jgi:4a-hydroxytetrahydrobiopterin dehydratase
MATVMVVSQSDPSILDLFPDFLSPDTSRPEMTSIVCEMSTKVVHAFLSSFHPPPPPHTTAHPPIAVALLPILRGALPMYVATYPLFPNPDTILVRCSKDKNRHGPESVIVEWMGARPQQGHADQRHHDNNNNNNNKNIDVSHSQYSEPDTQMQIVILDTILATGDTVVKLCDELFAPRSNTPDQAEQPSLKPEGEPRRFVTVLSCYASPQAIAAVAAHPAVAAIWVAHLADTVDEYGYLVSYTHGDVGDKLFGKKA